MLEWVDKRDEMPPPWEYVLAWRAGGSIHKNLHVAFRLGTEPERLMTRAEHVLKANEWTHWARLRKLPQPERQLEEVGLHVKLEGMDDFKRDAEELTTICDRLSASMDRLAGALGCRCEDKDCCP